MVLRKFSITIIFAVSLYVGIASCALPKLFSRTNSPKTNAQMQDFAVVEEPAQLEIFRKCYPDVEFTPVYDEKKDDWLVKIVAPVFPGKADKKEISLWWANCRLLPESELENKTKYWSLIYSYSKLKDPSAMTDAEIESVRNFSSSENRRSTGGTPMFFYDFLYGAKSRIVIEDHIVNSTFLGKSTKIHERIREPLKRVEQKIYSLAENETEIQEFIDSLDSADAYNWRVIEGTGGRKSFHSYGIAVDLLPKRLNGKAIFWSWTRDRDPENWMLTPFERRWSPPGKVIEIFEKEGFIWGGNWIIFDNMHFEYHPELIAAKNSKES